MYIFIFYLVDEGPEGGEDLLERRLRLGDAQEAQVHLEHLLHQGVVAQVRVELRLQVAPTDHQPSADTVLAAGVGGAEVSGWSLTLNPMMKMLSVSSTVRQTSVDTLASSRHWLLTSASVWGYTVVGVADRKVRGREREVCGIKAELFFPPSQEDVVLWIGMLSKGLEYKYLQCQYV